MFSSKARGIPPDEFYCWQVLEKSGSYVVPGRAFDMNGSDNHYYFRWDKREKKSLIHFTYIDSHILSVRPVCLPVCLSVCPSVCMSVCLSVSLSVTHSLTQSVCLSVCLSVGLSICMSLCMSACLHVCPSICLFVRLFVRPSFRRSVCLSFRSLALSLRGAARFENRAVPAYSFIHSFLILSLFHTFIQSLIN